MTIEYHAKTMSDGRVMWWLTEVIVVRDGWADTNAKAREDAKQYAKENEMELEEG